MKLRIVPYIASSYVCPASRVICLLPGVISRLVANFLSRKVYQLMFWTITLVACKHNSILGSAKILWNCLQGLRLNHGGQCLEGLL